MQNLTSLVIKSTYAPRVFHFTNLILNVVGYQILCKILSYNNFLYMCIQAPGGTTKIQIEILRVP